MYRPLLVLIGLPKVAFRGAGFTHDEFPIILREMTGARVEYPPEELYGFTLVEMIRHPDQDNVFCFIGPERGFSTFARDCDLVEKLSCLLKLNPQSPAR